MPALTAEQERSGLVIRTARKTWHCHGSTGREPDGRLIRCGQPIPPGTVHLEYLGESAAFESGWRYCAEHALEEWGVDLGAPSVQVR